MQIIPDLRGSNVPRHKRVNPNSRKMKTVFPTENNRFGLSLGTDFSYCKIYSMSESESLARIFVRSTQPGQDTFNNLAPLQINIPETFSPPDRTGGISEEFFRKWKPECANTIFPITLGNKILVTNCF
jgi:hypothetical protein